MCAASPLAVRAKLLERAPPGFARAWMAHDVFRRAQLHFTLHGRLLEIWADRPPAIMHWTYPLPMAFRGTSNIVTIHDLIPLTHPDLTDIDPVRFRRIVRRVVQRAAHIVTVSEASRRDIIALLGVAPGRVTNTYQPVVAPQPTLRPPSHQGHFLFCGTLEPRKNIARLIAAYTASGAAAPLILAGPDGWHAEAALTGADAGIRPLQAMPQHCQRRGVWRAPWLERAELLDLMRGARALLFPSLAEGFGLPIAEAMALGVPVLTSSTGATAEVAGGAAALVDPLDVSAMAETIGALDHDDALCGHLAAAGLQRAKAFSPEACFGRLDSVYRQVANHRA